MTTTTRAKSVAKKNARFSKQTPAEKRVAIAKDALAWIAAKALIPATGSYVSPEEGPLREFDFYGDGGRVDDQLRSVRLGVCNVCAIGALFIAKAVRFDKTTVGDLTSGRHRDSLTGFFSARQLSLIEIAFEGFSLNAKDEPTDEERGLAVEFWNSAGDSDRKRLVAILENIIANGGEFVP